MNQNTAYNRREFLKYMGGNAAKAGIVLIVPTALLGLNGCHSKGSDDAAPAPGLATKFTPQNLTIDSNLYGNGSTPALTSGARHNTAMTFIPKEDITAAIGYVLKDPSGKVEWEWYSQPILMAQNTQITTPNKSIPIKSSNGGLYDLDARIKVGNETDSLLRVSPQASMGPQVASTYTVKEAIDYLVGLYNGNANPGVVSVVGDTAPASDVVGAADLNSGILATVQSKYSINGTLTSKLVSELASLDAASGFQIGQKANNAYVNTLLGSLAPATGMLKAYDLRSGKLHLVVTGVSDMDVRRATRVVAQNGTYNTDYNPVKVDGTTLSDITTSQG